MNRFFPLNSLDEDSTVPKYRQIIDSILQDVETGVLQQGQRIPSINEMSMEYMLARDTVEKAYKELRSRGIIKSVRGKGYYVCSTQTDTSLKILMIFNKISAYKKSVYNGFKQAMGPEVTIDLRIHHHNADLLHSFIEGNLGNYGYFVVMPFFYDDMPKALEILRKIPPHQLLLLDKDIEGLKPGYASVFQDFASDLYDALASGQDLLSRYRKLVMVFPENIPYPPELVEGFQDFCRDKGFDHEVITEFEEGMPLAKGEVYCVIEESDLANVIIQSRTQHLELGRDVGIIAFNDTPLKKILVNGITVISTDHERMGKIAAELILDKSQHKIQNPYTLIRRHSL
ncbi:substrate-binding protein-like domain-containing protein [Catalinimonas alkaloidigena]|uniref:Substrate-binding protein-like domain-containing protein n=1 Tax=Catalinimonas alkaloidigena TaxID=1075417 RepID=A0A1G9SX06_9BACT|nr:GntR family transcriptional regulator [Catalinimonas alkaloidigena]SDM39971.1 substrate-binding protein-like domain-containing protein [Catalinimonas alkaloidigena]